MLSKIWIVNSATKKNGKINFILHAVFYFTCKKGIKFVLYKFIHKKEIQENQWMPSYTVWYDSRGSFGASATLECIAPLRPLFHVNFTIMVHCIYGSRSWISDSAHRTVVHALFASLSLFYNRGRLMEGTVFSCYNVCLYREIVTLRSCIYRYNGRNKNYGKWCEIVSAYKEGG